MDLVKQIRALIEAPDLQSASTRSSGSFGSDSVHLGETGPLSQGVQARRKALRRRPIHGMEARQKRPRGVQVSPLNPLSVSPCLNGPMHTAHGHAPRGGALCSDLLCEVHPRGPSTRAVGGRCIGTIGMVYPGTLFHRRQRYIPMHSYAFLGIGVKSEHWRGAPRPRPSTGRAQGTRAGGAARCAAAAAPSAAPLAAIGAGRTTARAGNRRFRRLSALRTHTKAPYKSPIQTGFA